LLLSLVQNDMPAAKPIFCASYATDYTEGLRQCNRQFVNFCQHDLPLQAMIGTIGQCILCPADDVRGLKCARP
jgi:hypothetical protein